MVEFQWLRGLALILCLALPAGCSVYSVPGQQPEPPGGQPVPSPERLPPDPPATPPSSPQQPPEPNASHAYGGLVAQAEQAAAGGDYERALALLERAQRIDPDSGEVYLALARTYTAQGNERQARAIAERGLLYCRERTECEALRGIAR